MMYKSGDKLLVMTLTIYLDMTAKFLFLSFLNFFFQGRNHMMCKSDVSDIFRHDCQVFVFFFFKGCNHMMYKSGDELLVMTLTIYLDMTAVKGMYVNVGGT